MTRRFCFALDLKPDPALIEEYKQQHKAIWPEITQELRKSGIETLEIYLFGTRMFMIMEVNENFSFEARQKAGRENPKMREWEDLMWKYQAPLPQAKPGEKWIAMERIFSLGDQPD